MMPRWPLMFSVLSFKPVWRRFAVFLDFLVIVHNRDLALTNVDGSISEAQLFKNEEITRMPLDDLKPY
ncbi:hypothetical protein DY000_02015769 [Brassica cretica]|uniref:Uncharacterized protein n=1 Tax=Brassica cretica TaxID=69181 RepID=A0ABQ7DCW8_BRACR|nr:hypothetical protein DY000_02015769 [Brassica cretica]